jgi:DNA-binding transcriptional LysR family regulator
MMNFNQLNIFYTVANEKSFSLAAKDLYLTQPDISIQIRLLEDSFGVQLIQKIRRTIELTDAGNILFSYAKRIFELSEEAEAIINDYRTLKRGALKIYTTGTIAKYYLPEILNYFRKDYPTIKIILKAENSQQAVDGVSNFESDIAITGRIDYGDKLSVIRFITDKVVLVASTKDDLCKQKKIGFKELMGKPIIIRETGSGLRKFILEIFEREGISPNIIMELGNCDAIKKLVEHGIGLSFLTYTMVKKEVEMGSLRVIDLSNINLRMDFDIVFHKSRESSKLIKAFVNEALRTIPKLKKINSSLSWVKNAIIADGTKKVSATCSTHVPYVE